MMGYEKVDGVWYKEYHGVDDPANVKANNVVQAVADKKIDQLEDALNDTEIGKFLGYTYNEDEGWWYDGVKKTTTIINTISKTSIKNLGTTLDTLTVADIFEAEDRNHGFLSLLPAEATLKDLGSNDTSNPKSMSSIFKSTTMGDYVNKGLITFSAATIEKLDGNPATAGWRDQTIQTFINTIMTFVP